MRLSVLFCFALFLAPLVVGQVTTESLQAGKTVEKSLAAGQTHSYTINLDKDQFVQLAVEQQGIDVLIRVFLPGGNLLREFNSPDGSEATEYVEVISDAAGVYRVEIAPAGETDSSTSGKYVLKIVESHKATDDELQFRKNESTRKAKGLALVVETSQSFAQFRMAETRVTMRIKAAQLLWPSDEKKALAQMAQAVETVKQFIAEYPEDDDFQSQQSLLAMRTQVLHVLTPHDPEAALRFLQSTKVATSLNDEQEIQLESSLIDQVLNKDPQRAFDLAEAMLQRTLSQALLETLNQLTLKDWKLAGRLAHDIVKKVSGEDFFKTPQSSYVASGLLQLNKNPRVVTTRGDKTQINHLLSDDDYRELLLKTISQFLAFKSSEETGFDVQSGIERALAVFLSQMREEIKTYAADRADAIDKRVSDLGINVTTTTNGWQKYQSAAMSEPIETALESVEQAPEGMREYLYQQVVNRVSASGDVSRARQLVAERITDPTQKKQLLQTIQQQAIATATQRGQLDEALRLIARLPRAERLPSIDLVIDQIGPTVKKSDAMQYLEQAKRLIGDSFRAESSEQMQTLLAIARAYARHDAARGFQTVEPLIDQFNEISAAAVVMNGFGGQYYVEGEMTTARDNTVSDLAIDISKTLATLAMSDFDRAKRDADTLTRFDARVRTLLTIAAQVLEIQLDEEMTQRRVIDE